QQGLGERQRERDAQCSGDPRVDWVEEEALESGKPQGGHWTTPARVGPIGSPNLSIRSSTRSARGRPPQAVSAPRINTARRFKLWEGAEERTSSASRNLASPARTAGIGRATP